MLRTAVLAVLAVAATLLAAPAQALTDDLPIDRTDPSGDVIVYDGGGTKPTTGQRKSIDLRRFSVTKDGDQLRFTFQIARIAAGRTFDQIVEAKFRKSGRDGFQLDVLANPQQKNGTAYVGDTACFLDVSTSRRTGTVRVDMPAGCAPKAAGVLRATTYLQEKNGSGPGFSEDTLRVPGEVRLR